MGIIDDFLDSDAAEFVDTDVFGESITYTPKGGSARTIKAVVHRHPPRSYQNDPARGYGPYLEIEVRNDATLGISSASVKLTVDLVTIAERRGESSTKTLPVRRLISQDAGMVRFALI